MNTRIIDKCMNNVVLVVYTTFLLMCVTVVCEIIQNEELLHDYNVEGRKKSEKSDLLTKILPTLAMPFIVQTLFLPVMLFFLKLTMINSMFLGKLGIFLWFMNYLFNRQNPEGALHSHAININHGRHPDNEGMYSNDPIMKTSNQNSYQNVKRKKRKK
ncbi:uncharacterized protein LOC114335079 isoform X1 [Diabrotica virgifera virgifera]|uniref:Uncharacterized protein n=1 Tax=Diabrotica virgifera virgifera TaxID=50390 RepID=A0ABM5JWP2_DIAVI|nr:uncharacterized protein LOC114335079 isoform X1 [Diabrotica virgifera virgifera]